MPRISFAVPAIIAAGALISGVAPSEAGEPYGVGVSVTVNVESGNRWHHAHHHPWRVTGPQTYYGYHYDHIPGYPVPIFPSHRPPLVVQPAAPYLVVASGHVEWCYARYRSYRAYDNSFQPYHGPRRQCWSPYR